MLCAIQFLILSATVSGGSGFCGEGLFVSLKSTLVLFTPAFSSFFCGLQQYNVTDSSVSALQKIHLYLAKCS